MLSRIHTLLAPPTFENDEDLTRLAKVIHFLISAIFCCTLFFCIFWAITSPHSLERLYFALPIFFLTGLASFFVKRKRIILAGTTIVFGLWLVLVVSAFFHGGIYSPAMGGFIIIVLLAALLLGRGVAIGIAGLSILATLFFIFGEKAGFITGHQFATPIAIWTSYTTYLLIAATLLHMATNSIQEALARARQEIEERERTEIALREAEFRYRSLVENLPVVTYRDAPNMEATSLYISPQIKQLLGYPPEMWLENPTFWQELLHPDDRARVIADTEEYITKATQSVIEYRLKTRDNRWVWVRDEATVLKDEQGTPLFVQGTLRDITARKQAEQALQASEEKFNKAFDSSPFPMSISSPTRGYIEVNEAFLHLLGYARTELIGKHDLEIGIWVNPEEQQKAIRILMQTGWLRDFEFKFQKKSGAIGTGLTSATLVQINEETCILASIFDLTQRKADEEALRTSEEKFQKAFLSSPVPMMINSPARGILNVNQAFEDLTGYQRKEILGKHAVEVGLWVDARQRQTSIDLVKQYGTLQDYEFLFRKKDGTIRVGSLAVDLIEIDQEKCYLASFQDITARKEIEDTLRNMNAELEARVEKRTAQLEATNRELESFSYSISHDLRAPLRAIHGFSRLLLEEYGKYLPPEAQRLQNLVQENALRMSRLIDDLLAFSRLGRSPIQMRPQPLEPLVTEVWQDLAHERGERQIEFVLHPLPSAMADRALLRQVFVNLLGNAIKFTRPRLNAHIEVGYQSIENENAYFVQDNGAGFDMQYADKLFGVFQRLHHENEFEGTGVGLAIVQRIIHRHGGKIWAYAQPNQGATFYFTLPQNSTQE